MAHLKDIDIFYHDTQTAAPATLCLHGRYGRGETWVDFIRHYGERYRVIAPDQRGHGLSGKPLSRYSVAEMSADMVALLQYLELDSAIVVGHSMGGGIAGYLAAHHPEMVKGLAILDKSAAGPEGVLPSLEEIAPIDPLTKDWPMPFSSLIEAQTFIKNALESQLSYEYFMNSLVETVAGYQMLFSAQAMAANIACYRSWFDLLPKLKCPVLLMRAKESGAVSDEDFAKMKALIPNCMACEIDHPDHNVHLGNKKEFYTQFDKFLNTINSSIA
jgi:2-succinyl-6-hydroxy-2,4-cyclohexadiene-1-carboxylate synthase